MTTYASTPKGIALLALESWRYNKSVEARAENEAESSIYAGRRQAYAHILQHITGRPAIDDDGATWKSIIARMY